MTGLTIEIKVTALLAEPCKILTRTKQINGKFKIAQNDVFTVIVIIGVNASGCCTCN